MGIQLEGDLPVLNDLIGSSIVSKKFYYQWLKLLSSGINIIVNNKWLSPYLCFCFCLFLVILLHLFSRSNIPKPRPFFRDQIFSNRYWDIFLWPIFRDPKRRPSKKFGKCLETEMSHSVYNNKKWHFVVAKSGIRFASNAGSFTK